MIRLDLHRPPAVSFGLAGLLLVACNNGGGGGQSDTDTPATASSMARSVAYMPVSIAARMRSGFQAKASNTRAATASASSPCANARNSGPLPACMSRW